MQSIYFKEMLRQGVMKIGYFGKSMDSCSNFKK